MIQKINVSCKRLFNLVNNQKKKITMKLNYFMMIETKCDSRDIVKNRYNVSL